MQTDLLFERFDDLLATPDDVKRLEAAILRLAVRGLLVRQDSGDGSAAELLERIRAEKERLIRERKIRKPKPIPPVAVEEILYKLPDGWSWCRLGELCTIRGGKRVPKGYQLLVEPTAHIYIRVTDMKNGTIRDVNLRYISEQVFQKIQKYIIEKNDLYITIAGTIGNVGQVPERFHQMNLTENAARITPYQVDKQYLKFVLNSPPIQKQFQEKVNQMAQPKLALMRIKTTLVPLPPLAEQRRIVAKVDALLAQTRALAAQLEGADAALAPTAQAAFHALLDAPDSAAQRAAWQRVDAHFDTLTRDPRAIAALKRMILQLAVQGRLVRQDSGDEPASVLVERIKVEKAKLVQEGKIRKSKPLPLIKDDEVLYALPDGWEWVRIGNITNHRLGKMLDKRKNKGEYFPYLRNLNVQWLRINLDDVLQMRFENHEIDEFTLRQGDLLICEGGEPGRCAIWERPDLQMMFQKAIHRVRPFGGILPKYLLYHIWADAGNRVLEKYFTGATIKHFTGKALTRYILALPPLPEQRRIVAKVEALLALCDELAAQEERAQEVRGRLLWAVLNTRTN